MCLLSRPEGPYSTDWENSIFFSKPSVLHHNLNLPISFAAVTSSSKQTSGEEISIYEDR